MKPGRYILWLRPFQIVNLKVKFSYICLVSLAVLYWTIERWTILLAVLPFSVPSKPTSLFVAETRFRLIPPSSTITIWLRIQPIFRDILASKGWIEWQLCHVLEATESLRYPDGTSVAHEAWPTLPRLPIAHHSHKKTINLDSIKESAKFLKNS